MVLLLVFLLTTAGRLLRLVVTVAALFLLLAWATGSR